MDQVPSSSQDARSLPTCYRHPDRETGISCTRCERPICPECMVSASVGFQCPECVRDGSGTGRAPSASAPRTLAGGTVTADPRLLTKILIGANLLLFLVNEAIGDAFTDRFALVGQGFDSVGSVQGVAEGQWYRLVTSMFLHSGVMHIAFNMLSLWWIGGPLEAALGRARYLALYFASGLAGSALTYLLAAPNQWTLGASGAIFGLFGATAVLMRRLKYDMRPVIILLVINLVITFGWSGIAWQAHVGGLVGGVLIGYAMVHAPRERRGLIQYGACALVLLAVVVVTLLRTAQLT
ncbi:MULTISPECIES: rhomboid family intramembrane serine protease [Streptomyces]|uniref:Rhomboid family intramembrane serine protease n=1 Tax=Streptomyces caniscabiei TaxID=2746961 RepID=A0ABU4MFT3_9ACTN|nr:MULTISPECIES: rhomboid family intramembrane serine protease [Streptomyces]MBE4734790.1 rhomboid family intramembrane serine protease [Streptomyces caniscabiei]MBE4753924.1 rhomboid family intramembrane serine protease [Streptomyces caniscabiei]MBE4767517.1 rhomboid family intramembrane serine protease [Streptomyces caniscabiei]MBE4783975.1 rhomboid family intramembrane serine protease [Streptomyces caniscabiei]MBE4791526.1 rhomboid family intramembrane serine protease [Streptomyces caniscab